MQSQNLFSLSFMNTKYWFHVEFPHCVEEVKRDIVELLESKSDWHLQTCSRLNKSALYVNQAPVAPLFFIS